MVAARIFGWLWVRGEVWLARGPDPEKGSSTVIGRPQNQLIFGPGMRQNGMVCDARFVYGSPLDLQLGRADQFRSLQSVRSIPLKLPYRGRGGHQHKISLLDHTPDSSWDPNIELVSGSSSRLPVGPGQEISIFGTNNFLIFFMETTFMWLMLS
jgi:hypothetical protein